MPWFCFPHKNTTNKCLRESFHRLTHMLSFLKSLPTDIIFGADIFFQLPRAITMKIVS